MADFSHLSNLEVKSESTAELTLHWILLPNGKSPVLIGRHAGTSNKPYVNALLKKGIRKGKKVKLTFETMNENRTADRALYPKFVITGWRDVTDSKMKDVKFTEDECASFLEQLPDHIFDEVRGFFADVDNFADVLDMEDIAATGND